MHKKFSDGLSAAILFGAAIAFIFAAHPAAPSYDAAADLERPQSAAVFTLAALVPSADDLNTWAQLHGGNFGIEDDAAATPTAPAKSAASALAEAESSPERPTAHLALSRAVRYDRDGNIVNVDFHHGS